ncbi:hypothetical protein DFP73DRAFT_620670 [Morchella snyderi]|nr:hypothetical protein DFP73DRAFT_620670 [Morchella snyderi]
MTLNMSDPLPIASAPAANVLEPASAMASDLDTNAPAALPAAAPASDTPVAAAIPVAVDDTTVEAAFDPVALAAHIPVAADTLITINSDSHDQLQVEIGAAARDVDMAPVNKRKRLRNFGPVTVDGHVFKIPMDISERAFHHVHNMVANSLKALATDDAKVNSSDMALVYGPPVPIPSVEVAVRNNMPEFVGVSESESDKSIVNCYKRKHLNHTSRSNASESTINEMTDTNNNDSEASVPVPVVHKRKMRLSRDGIVGNFVSINDAVAKTGHCKQWVEGKYIECFMLLNGTNARTERVVPECTDCAMSKGRHKTQCVKLVKGHDDYIASDHCGALQIMQYIDAAGGVKYRDYTDSATGKYPSILTPLLTPLEALNSQHRIATYCAANTAPYGHPQAANTAPPSQRIVHYMDTPRQRILHHMDTPRQRILHPPASEYCTIWTPAGSEYCTIWTPPGSEYCSYQSPNTAPFGHPRQRMDTYQSRILAPNGHPQAANHGATSHRILHHMDTSRQGGQRAGGQAAGSSAASSAGRQLCGELSGQAALWRAQRTGGQAAQWVAQRAGSSVASSAGRRTGSSADRRTGSSAASSAGRQLSGELSGQDVGAGQPGVDLVFVLGSKTTSFAQKTNPSFDQKTTPRREWERSTRLPPPAPHLPPLTPARELSSPLESELSSPLESELSSPLESELSSPLTCLTALLRAELAAELPAC